MKQNYCLRIQQRSMKTSNFKSKYIDVHDIQTQLPGSYITHSSNVYPVVYTLTSHVSS